MPLSFAAMPRLRGERNLAEDVPGENPRGWIQRNRWPGRRLTPDDGHHWEKSRCQPIIGFLTSPCRVP
ncbi:hypothetical protein SJ05684_c01990 [Sinorhizobium sojae CCBAU 05684]|uniref:Uncharacterized protein n=1 Tax=Sinorhizobium sojae CCBAU 05684 TaxID=716928 RepID=A0A249P8T2_9HYPH|nr:hypothetical protein SJ05684_c01990 [Sinorhizobium sojae CCBAU 05684]